MGGNYSSLIMIALMVVVFYFLLIRPQRKRQQEQIQMQNSITPGTRVMTTTGLFATVVAIDADDVILEVAPGVETRWVKAAIGRVVTPVPDAEDAPEASDDVVKTVEQGDDHDSTTRKP
ncbi:preprotein translocase subunit YajC [Streptosporangium becharense]|uniref:Preprotein translocase subunit YajC n=1 Tax=Streptosporangium becharense TaxID=1816182 RepID=A0A7W9ICL7_9ACTN|nr:preprotein translocase subunit YajC [Streptosporangium becharense]MBB2914996.1 preprotein translocase subunit YajC [Streptosporangium becharense]MBB5818045.1 preprotein translocase subunit YajC [Streptosporangium becharense]